MKIMIFICMLCSFVLVVVVGVMLLVGCVMGLNVNLVDLIELFNCEVFCINEDFDKGVLKLVV